jgi:DNA-binding CsgD family transcriptional regulator
MSIKNERRFISFFLFMVGLLSAVDVYEDMHEGTTLEHISVEILLITFCISGAIFFWKKSVSKLRKENSALHSEIASVRSDANHWKKETSELLAGLGKAIDDQMDLWNLTESEKEVALLLLKGLSHKEVADIRGTSEKTIRQQSTQVYRKGSLEGRAQLSAFFLEDLLLPQDKEGIKQNS